MKRIILNFKTYTNLCKKCGRLKLHCEQEEYRALLYPKFSIYATERLHKCRDKV